jgi:hypothetical protein
MSGCIPDWSTAPITNDAVVTLPSATQVNRLIIDGELITYVAVGGYLPRISDSSNPPGSAPSTNDKPVYLYLCGGRHFPVCAANSPGPGSYYAAPLILIESATPPDLMGHPTADLSTVAPSRSIPKIACLYIGVSFITANSSNHKSVYYDGDFVRSQVTPAASPAGPSTFHEAPTSVDSTGSNQPFTLGSTPAPSTIIELTATLQAAAARGVVIYSSSYGPVMYLNTLGATSVYGTGRAKRTAPTVIMTHFGLNSADTLAIRASAFNMRIPRVGG